MKTYREPIEWSNTWIDRWSTQAQDAYSSLREHFKYGTQHTHFEDKAKEYIAAEMLKVIE